MLKLIDRLLWLVAAGIVGAIIGTCILSELKGGDAFSRAAAELLEGRLTDEVKAGGIAGALLAMGVSTRRFRRRRAEPPSVERAVASSEPRAGERIVIVEKARSGGGCMTVAIGAALLFCIISAIGKRDDEKKSDDPRTGLSPGDHAIVGTPGAKGSVAFGVSTAHLERIEEERKAGDPFVNRQGSLACGTEVLVISFNGYGAVDGVNVRVLDGPHAGERGVVRFFDLWRRGEWTREFLKKAIELSKTLPPESEAHDGFGSRPIDIGSSSRPR